MCVLSVVTDYYRTNIWPTPTGAAISWEEYQEYLSIKKQAIAIDTRFDQPDCAKPEIEEWEKEVELAAKLWKQQNS